MNAVERYAIRLVAEGAISCAEDDMNEDLDLPTAEDHEAAVNLALNIAKAIRTYPEAILALANYGLPRERV